MEGRGFSLRVLTLHRCRQVQASHHSRHRGTGSAASGASRGVSSSSRQIGRNEDIPAASLPSRGASGGGDAATGSLPPGTSSGVDAPRLRSAFYAFPAGPDDLAVDLAPGEQPQAAPGICGHWMPGRMQLAVGGGRASTVRMQAPYCLPLPCPLAHASPACPPRCASGISRRSGAQALCQLVARAGARL